MGIISRKKYAETAVIAESGTTSQAIDLDSDDLVGIIIPSAFTGTAVTITMSDSLTGTYATVQDGDGADLTLTVAASKYIPINNLNVTAGLRFIKVVSNATEAAERTLILAQRRTT